MANEKKTLSKIKSGVISRGLSLAKMSLNVGAKAASHTLTNFFAAEDEKGERFKALLVSQLEVVSRELGQLKGSVMKVGQMLSVYGEHFLPPEVNSVLKSLQSQSPPLSWVEMRKVLEKELGDVLEELEIDPEPIAAASLGQVYKARLKNGGKIIALKVQYPAVDRAIEGDLRALKLVLSAIKLIPQGPRFDALFEEVREMLLQETDYAQELRATEEFQSLLKADPNYIVPTPFPKFSTSKVMATSLELGHRLDSPEVKALSQDRRNALGLAALELYFLELFRFGKMQTDPHFGNYRIQLAQSELKKDRIILYDFGAVKTFDPEFLRHYRLMTHGAFYRNEERILTGAQGLRFIQPADSEELKKAFCQLCFLYTEPFQGDYDFGTTDLPSRVATEGARLALNLRFRPPPREIVFLDRKMGGVFILLSALGVKINSRDLLEKYLNPQG